MLADIPRLNAALTGRYRRTLFTLGPEFLLGTDGFDVSLDDQRFLMARRTDLALSGAPQITFVLVQNYFTELRRLSPN